MWFAAKLIKQQLSLLLGNRHLATIVGPEAWCLEERSVEVEGVSREGGRTEGRRSVPLPFSSTAGSICMCGNVSQNQFWFSKLHTLKGSQEQLYSSYHLKCHLTKAFFVTNLANLFSISSCISSYSTSSPGPASAGLVAIAFAASSRSLLTRNQGFDSFCCQDALYFLPTFFFVLLVGLNGFRSC